MSKAETTFVVPFVYQSTEIRTITDPDGTPWFVLKDVCDVLEHTNPSVAIEILEDDERSKKSLGRQGSAWVISESGLYTLIMRSNKPEAKAFRRWVTHEVLPALRKTGRYVMPGAQCGSSSEQVVDGSRQVWHLSRAFTEAVRACKKAGMSNRQALIHANEAMIDMTGIDMFLLLRIDANRLVRPDGTFGTYTQLLDDISALNVPDVAGEYRPLMELLTEAGGTNRIVERYGLKWLNGGSNSPFHGTVFLHPDTIAETLLKYASPESGVWSPDSVRACLKEVPNAHYGRSCPTIRLGAKVRRGIIIPINHFPSVALLSQGNDWQGGTL